MPIAPCASTLARFLCLPLLRAMMLDLAPQVLLRPAPVPAMSIARRVAPSAARHLARDPRHCNKACCGGRGGGATGLVARGLERLRAFCCGAGAPAQGTLRGPGPGSLQCTLHGTASAAMRVAEPGATVLQRPLRGAGPGARFDEQRGARGLARHGPRRKVPCVAAAAVPCNRDCCAGTGWRKSRCRAWRASRVAHSAPCNKGWCFFGSRKFQ